MAQLNPKRKVLHIHSDAKFIGGVDLLFNNVEFENSILFLSEDEVNSNHRVYRFSSIIDVVRFYKRSIEVIDIVVFWGLNQWAFRLLSYTPTKVYVIWRFFGYELYSKMEDVVLSKKTKEALVNNSQNRTIFTQFKQALIDLRYPKLSLEDTFKKVDLVLMLSEQEYNYLNSYWGYKLPKFLKIPHKEPASHISDGHELNLNVDRVIRVIIGHSRSKYINHLDIYELITDEIANDKKIEFYSFFNYDLKGSYAKLVRKKGEERGVRFIDQFMTLTEFDSFFQSATSFVINSYRQLAGATIFLALKHGHKVYLNRKNPHFNWLNEEGFRIFSIEEFATDLVKQDLILSLEDRAHNFNNFVEFSNRYPSSLYNDELTKRLGSKLNDTKRFV
jgi:dTDP-N-acetylfucosamine:lipid II N-acetylfucosaminyltransferase